MKYCPITKEECVKDCELYDEKFDMCSCRLAAKALADLIREVSGAASALNNIGINTEFWGG